MLLTYLGNINVLRYHKKGGRGQKIAVLKVITKGEERDDEKTQILDYVIHGWSLTISSLISKSKKVEKS